MCALLGINDFTILLFFLHVFLPNLVCYSIYARSLFTCSLIHGLQIRLNQYSVIFEEFRTNSLYISIQFLTAFCHKAIFMVANGLGTLSCSSFSFLDVMF